MNFAELLRKLIIHLFVKANSCAKCPACGIRKIHSVKWSTLHQQLLHTCDRCEAVWGEAPMVKADLWAGPAVQPETEKVTTITHAQREPQIVKAQ